MINRVRGTTVFFGWFAVTVLIIAPPIGFWLCVALYFLFKSDRKRVKRHDELVRRHQEQKRERAMILAYKSLP